MKLTQPSAKKRLKLLRPLPPRKSQPNAEHQDASHSNVVSHSQQGVIKNSQVLRVGEDNQVCLSSSASEHQSRRWLQQHAPSHTRPVKIDKNDCDKPSRINGNTRECNQKHIHLGGSIHKLNINDHPLVPKPHIHVLGGRQSEQEWHHDHRGVPSPSGQLLPGSPSFFTQDALDHDRLDGLLVKCSSHSAVVVGNGIQDSNAVHAHVPRRLRSSPTSPSPHVAGERRSKLKPLPPRAAHSHPVLLKREGNCDSSRSSSSIPGEASACQHQARFLHSTRQTCGHLSLACLFHAMFQ
jgi:hypothetical protein